MHDGSRRRRRQSHRPSPPARPLGPPVRARATRLARGSVVASLASCATTIFDLTRLGLGQRLPLRCSSSPLHCRRRRAALPRSPVDGRLLTTLPRPGDTDGERFCGGRPPFSEIQAPHRAEVLSQHRAAGLLSRDCREGGDGRHRVDGLSGTGGAGTPMVLVFSVVSLPQCHLMAHAGPGRRPARAVHGRTSRRGAPGLDFDHEMSRHFLRGARPRRRAAHGDGQG